MNPKSYLMRFIKMKFRKKKSVNEKKLKVQKKNKENNGTVHSMVHNEGVYSEI
jgi:hypothetical protein